MCIALFGLTAFPVQAASPTHDACSRPARRLLTASTAGQLRTALSNARAGDRITLARTRFRGRFTLTASGTASARIAVCGAGSVVDGGGITTGYGFHLTGQYVDLVGLAITRSQKGVVLDGAAHAVLDGLTVSQIGDEAIHLRRSSLDVVVQRSSIHHTGLRVASYGEGVYVGTARDSACTDLTCPADHSDGAIIRDNRFWALGAEGVDAKEGTRRGSVTGNSFDGAGSSAYSWVDIKGNAWTVSRNTGARSRRDGYSVSEAVAGWGQGNRIADNRADVRGPGYGVRVTRQNTVGCDNQVTGAAAGAWNVACT